MIYLDNNATTRIDPAVRDAMIPWLEEEYGNPSAGYRFGRRAREAVDTAREQVAALIGCHPEEIIFTSGGTESIGTAIRSAVSAQSGIASLVSSTVEHSAVHETFRYFESLGHRRLDAPVDSLGALDLDAWDGLVAEPGVTFASLIWANNETGVISDVEEAADRCADHGVFLHADAVQAAGKIPISVETLPVHALSLSAHKLHGPKGVGALYIDRHVAFRPLALGGGQEDGRRSGTENVPGIVGFGCAARLAAEHLDEAERIAGLRDDFESRVLASVKGVEVNGDPHRRLPNTTNLYFPGIDGEGLLILLDEAGVCCSPGSACSTGSVQPSRIILAMGHHSARARSSVRFSLSRLTTREEIDAAVLAVTTAAKKLRVTMPSGSRVVSTSR